MPKSLAKVSKKISRKTGGHLNSLHENSRNSQRLRRASARDDKLAQRLLARTKSHQPLLQRVAFFQDAAREEEASSSSSFVDGGGGGVFSEDKVRELIRGFIVGRDVKGGGAGQGGEGLHKTVSTKVALQEQARGLEEREFETGFWCPDMQDRNNLGKLRAWGGEWSSLATMKFVRIGREGGRVESQFPPR